MVDAVSFHVDDVAGHPPVKLLAIYQNRDKLKNLLNLLLFFNKIKPCHYGFIDRTSVKHFPFGVAVQMSCIGDVLIAILLNAHLFHGVSPGIKVYLATLGVKRKVGNFYDAFRVDPDLWYPSDDSRMGYPRVEVFHLHQILVFANSFEWVNKVKSSRSLQY
jgi:hypothetical protein